MPKQDVAVELYYDGAWHDIAAADEVFADDPIVITRGQGDQGAAPRPCSITCRLDNRTDRYRTSNPVSPLYGKVGRNTPARVSVADVVRGTVQATSWQAGQSRDFRATPARGKAWVDFEGGGVLEQINGWSTTVKSPMRAQNDTYAARTTGYFPLEDKAGALSISTPTPGATTLAYTGSHLRFGQGGRFAGTDPLAECGSDVEQQFNFVQTGLSDSGYQISWASQHEQVFPAGALTHLMTWTATNGGTYILSYTGGTSDINVLVVLSGVTVVDTDIPVGTTLSYLDWNLFRAKVTSSGGTVSVELSWYPEGGTSFAGTTVTHSGTTGALKFALFRTGDQDDPIVPKYGHLLGLSTGADDLQSADRVAAFNGHKGETAADRFTRLMALYGITAYTIIGTIADSQPMGAQPSAERLPDLLKEIATTEDGLIFDDIAAYGLVFLLRNGRYNQTPALTLTPEDLPALPTEVTDKLDVHNVVTVSQKDGGEATARDDTGPLGTQAPPNGVNEELQTVDVNVDDERDLPDLANWWLRRGTVDLPRFPKLTVNLAALDPDKVAEVEAVDVGSVLTIVGFREYTIRLHVLGYTEVIGWPNARTITFVCAPDQQFNVGAYEGVGEEWDDLTRRYDSASTTLASATPSTTWGSLSLTTTDAKDVWSTTGEPYDIVVAGERLTVTSMSAVSGTGPYLQTATVTRSVNGVVKILPAGAEVHVAEPGRWAL